MYSHSKFEPFLLTVQIANGTSERSPRSHGSGHLPGQTTTVGVVSGREEQEREKSSPKTSSTRLKSLDSFRG